MAKKKLFPKIDTSNMLISETGEVLDKEKYMADKKADTINTCWICGRQFLATHIMGDPVCPACEKTKIKKVELSDEYQHNHLQEAMDYALKEKGFVKRDSGKLRWSLMPFEELEDVVKVLMHGAEKYSPDNWKKCDDITRYKDALMRHAVAYVSGDKIDPEFGLSHLAHAICNCLFLMWFDKHEEDKKV